MPSLVEYKCPNCGSAIVFDSGSQQFMCRSCNSTFTEQQLNSYDDMIKSASANSECSWENGGNNEQMDGMNSYTCQSCGAQIITDATTSASSCPYCGNPIIMAEQLKAENRPDFIIPFKLDKKQAADKLTSFCKGKRLLPSGFLGEKKISEMKGLYVPFWLFTCGVSANVVYEATSLRKWTEGEYDCTETIYFEVFRSGTIAFADIPVDGSTKMDDSYMDGIEPFDYNEMTPFNPAYLSGYLADKYDVTAEASYERAENRIKNSTASEFMSTISGYATVIPKMTNVITNSGNYKYALLPVWMMTTKYRGKSYISAINGQNGNIAGELPIDKKKSVLWFAGITAALTLIGQLLVLLGGRLL